MALVNVLGPNFSSDNASGGDAADSATLKYTVLYNGAGSETAVDALNETGIPAPGAAHPSLANLTANKRTATRLGKSWLFDVVIQYNTIDVSIGGSKAEAPTDRDTQWSERGRPSQVEVDTRDDGVLLTTSAKERLQISIPYSDLSLIAVKNYAARTDFTGYFNKVNSAIFQGYAVKRLFLPHVDQVYTEEFYDGAMETYWQCTFVFQALIPRTSTDPTTWEYQIVDEGVKKKGATKPISIVDAQTGAQGSSPFLLDGSGDVLATAGTPYFLNDDGTGTLKYSTSGKVDMYLTADFTAIGL